MKKRIVLFGANADGRKVLQNLKPLIWMDQVEVIAFLDNDKRLSGGKIENIPNLNPQKITELSFEKIIVCIIFGEEACIQLQGLGVNKVKIEFAYEEPLFSKQERVLNGCRVGKYSYFKPSTLLVNTQIGNFCHIADNCQIGLSGHRVDLVSTYPLSYHFENVINDPSEDITANKRRMESQTIIKNDVYIGEGVTIMSGVEIGNGAVIGSKSFVNKDINDYAVVGGVPAREIKLRFSVQEIDRLLSIAWWNWPEDQIKKNTFKINSNVKEFLNEFNEEE